MISPYDVIRSLIRTEKSSLQEPDGKYLFLVEKSSNKSQIKRAVEEVYKVKVTDVNTIISPGKLTRVRYQYGKKPDFKKAIVTLKKGQKIETA
ncbi:MAG: 50S ribosomal protein L23 [Candidatus Omnitrophota bacterium]|nr:50S ribosomal protein L23 [Candidatus Omnitrophota bacterium]MBU1928740.1 50S ribosomal protein L23 [Candidatus Omnitrophota bacterium]MBU2034195.1 50S ribosomal protein L23 [Candidatus Omnitrophota bacterium]MBU2221150.1 50S ribosomal protein L23 [Candidatus Omnitrophota bacterium]MBU2258286.1 50S ribosomal protein L23 [Candidatus Omnitrophota bacterium]